MVGLDEGDVFCAKVTGRANNNAINVVGDIAANGVTLYQPYGIYSLPPVNQTVILTKLGNGYTVTGCQMLQRDMNQGEVCIFSSGGASIRLLNTGEIYLNATRIAPN